jgi:DNA-binding transcriptional LysR family regulator
MTLQQLQYFLAAIDHGSFSAAAESLHLAQPSLSEQIRRLEAELGSPLFSRGGRGLELTEAGRRLRPHAERVLASADDARSSVREISDLVEGTLSFGTFGNAPYYLLSDLVQDFKTRHPGVHLRLTGLNSSTVADAVRDGHLEAGLIVLPIDDRGLEVKAVARDEIVFMSRDPDRLAQPMTIERLVESPLILYDARYGWDDPTRRQLLERAQAAGVTLEPDIEVEYVEAALELCARGLGDTVAARAIGVGRGFARRVGTVSFDPPLFDAFAFIHRRNAHLSPATRAFMALAEKRITGLVQRVQDTRAA